MIALPSSLEMEQANRDWGANCGPYAAAAALGVTMAKVKDYFLGWPGYTNQRTMCLAQPTSIRTGSIGTVSKITDCNNAGIYADPETWLIDATHALVEPRRGATGIGYRAAFVIQRKEQT